MAESNEPPIPSSLIEKLIEDIDNLEQHASLNNGGVMDWNVSAKAVIALIRYHLEEPTHDVYFQLHISKGASEYEAALLAHDDVKSDRKRGKPTPDRDDSEAIVEALKMAVYDLKGLRDKYGDSWKPYELTAVQGTICDAVTAMGEGNETGLTPVPDKNAPSPAKSYDEAHGHDWKERCSEITGVVDEDVLRERLRRVAHSGWMSRQVALSIDDAVMVLRSHLRTTVPVSVNFKGCAAAAK